MTGVSLLLGFSLFVVIVWLLSPQIVFILDPTRLQTWFLENPDSDQLIARSATVQEWLHELRLLGFNLLGVRVEKFPLWGSHFYEIATSNPQANIFASIYITSNGTPYSLYYFTPLLGGGFILTKTLASERMSEQLPGNVFIAELPNDDFTAAFRVHQEQLSECFQIGLRVDDVSDKNSRLAAAAAFYASQYTRRKAPSTLRSPLVFALLILLLLLLGLFITETIKFFL